MSEFENPTLTNSRHTLTIDEVRALSSAATPHFALHIRNRLRRLVAPLPDSHPAMRFAQSEIARLEKLSVDLEHGPAGGSDLPSLRV
jgi:hypothetical protein